jgi:ADP-ribosylglycohydrolase
METSDYFQGASVVDMGMPMSRKQTPEQVFGTKLSRDDVPTFTFGVRGRKARRQLVMESAASSAAISLVLGDAIGDAFGFGIEMQDAFWIRSAVTRFDQWPESPVLTDSKKENNVRGFYSDDTEMTVGLLKALVRDGVGLSKEGMWQAWTAEWELAKTRPLPAEVGGERQGHGSAKHVWRGSMTLDQVREKQAAKTDPGNAPPMRALPLGFVSSAMARERLSAANADATHPHPKARAASFLVATACRLLVVERRPKAELLRSCLDALCSSALREPATEAHLEALDGLPDFHSYGQRFGSMPPTVHELLCGQQPCPSTLNKECGEPGDHAEGRRMHGMASDSMRTVGAVLYLVKHHRGPLDVLTASIDLGGDVDSIAALTVGLVGGSSGLGFGEPGGLSWKLVEELEGVEYLIQHARAFEAWVASTQGGGVPAPSGQFTRQHGSLAAWARNSDSLQGLLATVVSLFAIMLTVACWPQSPPPPPPPTNLLTWLWS